MMEAQIPAPPPASNGGPGGGAAPSPAEPDRLLTSSEAAALFGVSSETVTRWANRGMLSFIRTPGGRDMRFRESVVRKLREDL